MQGLFAAMKDRRLETVLSLIHREPWCPWTVEKLCAQAGISKTVLTEKFTKMMGCTPGEYLTRWRMQTAAKLLTESALPLPVIAERCGYLSLSAFTQRFKQSLGMSPGAYRRRGETG
jgi:AraC-like DNA-binding protein